MKIVDETGKIVKNHYRSQSGVILVDDKNGIERYKIQQRDAQRVRELEREVDELKAMVRLLLEKQNG